MVERSLSMREVPGSIPGASTIYFLVAVLNISGKIKLNKFFVKNQFRIPSLHSKMI